MLDKLYKRHRFTFTVLFWIATLVYLGSGYAAFGVLIVGVITAVSVRFQNPGNWAVSVILAIILLAIAVGGQIVHQDMEHTFWRNQ